jgi:hypothetical protein
MEVSGDSGQIVLVEWWWEKPDHNEVEEENKEMEIASVIILLETWL